MTVLFLRHRQLRYSTLIVSTLVRLCLTFLLCISPLTGIASQTHVGIVNAIVIDGTGAAPLHNARVLIHDETIAAVGPNVAFPKHTRVIDAKGQVLMPGLADMHIHFTDGGDGFDFLGYQRRLNAFLYAGVTTVFDTGGVLPFLQQIKKAIDAEVIQGPHIFYVGPLIDSLDPRWPVISRSMASTSQASDIATYLKTHGASAIKAYANLSRPQMWALVRAGNEVGLPVIVDAWVRNGFEHMVTLGLRAFAHTPSRVTPQTLKVMKQRNVMIISTLGIGEYQEKAKQGHTDFLASPLLTRTMPHWAIDKTRSLSKRRAPSEAFEPGHFYGRQKHNLKQIHAAGITVVAGTDDTGHFSGEELHRELEQLVEAGLSPLQAIQAATDSAARLLEQQGQWGVIKPGARADLLLVDGRPDLRISETRNITLLMKAGEIIDRAALVLNEQASPSFRDTSTDYAEKSAEE